MTTAAPVHHAPRRTHHDQRTHRHRHHHPDPRHRDRRPRRRLLLGHGGPDPPPARRARARASATPAARTTTRRTATTRVTPRPWRSSSTPTKTTYRDILAFFFQIHDPSTLNRQGNDIGIELPLGDLPAQRRAGGGRPRHDRRRGRLRPLAGRRRHDDRARRPVLGGRARAPGLPGAHPVGLHLPLRAAGLEAPPPRGQRHRVTEQRSPGP